MDKPMLTIFYCVPCDYLPRAQWQGGELLRSLQDTIAGLTIIPATGGTYDVQLGEDLLFSKAVTGRFPELDELRALAFSVVDQDLTPA